MFVKSDISVFFMSFIKKTLANSSVLLYNNLCLSNISMRRIKIPFNGADRSRYEYEQKKQSVGFTPDPQVFQGALIGLGAVLPGISGGVLCVVFGIYKP